MNASKADKLPPLHTSLVTLLMQILQAHAHATVPGVASCGSRNCCGTSPQVVERVRFVRHGLSVLLSYITSRGPVFSDQVGELPTGNVCTLFARQAAFKEVHEFMPMVACTLEAGSCASSRLLEAEQTWADLGILQHCSCSRWALGAAAVNAGAVESCTQLYSSTTFQRLATCAREMCTVVTQQPWKTILKSAQKTTWTRLLCDSWQMKKASVPPPPNRRSQSDEDIQSGQPCK
jgi:hypothetical protein